MKEHSYDELKEICNRFVEDRLVTPKEALECLAFFSTIETNDTEAIQKLYDTNREC